MTSIREKFNPVLHTETGVDAHIHALLGDETFAQYISEVLTAIEEKIEKYRQAVVDLNKSKPHQIEWGSTKSDLLTTAESLQRALDGAFTQVQLACALLSEHKLEVVQRVDWNSVWTMIGQAYRAYRKTVSAFDVSKLAYTGKEDDRERVLDETMRIVHQPAWVAGGLLDGSMGLAIHQLEFINQTDLHILGDAGVGKTHIASNICHERLKASLPALLVLGRHFTSDLPLQRQLLDVLDIPPSYSWEDFLKALEAAAQAYHTRVPLIIDGLNEATRNGAFSDVCVNVEYMHDFGAYNVERGVEKYFSWYKIKADLTAAPLSQFQHPIYLRNLSLFHYLKSQSKSG